MISKITDKINSLKPLDIVMLALAFSIMLVFLRPALVFLSDNTRLGGEFHADYGIPSNWTSTLSGPESSVVVSNGSIGLDFLCTDTYIRCAGAGVNIYKKFCAGDPYFRPYAYPPLMTYLALWIPFFSTQRAIALWATLILLSIFTMTFFLLRRLGYLVGGDTKPLIVATLLTFSYPSLFCYERGTNDLWVVGLFFAATYAILNEKWFWLGVAVSISAFLKIFPATATAAIAGTGIFLAAAGIVKKNKPLKRMGFHILAGELISSLLILLFLFQEYHYYFIYFIKLIHQNLSKTIYLGDRPINHSLGIMFGGWGFLLGTLLWLTGAAAFSAFLYRLSREEKNRGLLKYKALFSFGYLSLLTTYFVNINSFDYNLVLGLPFFCVAAAWNIPKNSALMKAACAFFFLGITLPRWSHLIFPGPPDLTVAVYLLLQSLGLLLFAALQLKMVFCDEK